MLNELLKNIARLLNRNNIHYMIIGGQAAILYRDTRFTNDIDITILFGLENLDVFVELCREIKLESLVDNLADFVSNTMVLPMIHMNSGFRVDFIFSNTIFEQEAYNRIKKVKLDDIEIHYCSLEDIIIYKVISWRERDRDDIKKIMLKNQKYNKDLIFNYLKKFSDELNIDFIQRFQMIIDGYEENIFSK